MKTTILAVTLGLLLAAPGVRAGGYYDDDARGRGRHVHTERTSRGETVCPQCGHVYRADEAYVERRHRRSFFNFLPPAPHRIIAHILFGDPVD